MAGSSAVVAAFGEATERQMLRRGGWLVAVAGSTVGTIALIWIVCFCHD